MGMRAGRRNTLKNENSTLKEAEKDEVGDEIKTQRQRRAY